MTKQIPQDILDALTDVDMSRLSGDPELIETIAPAAYAVPVHRAGCIVMGSGAAGLRAAVELKRRGGDVTIISQSAWGGTSACSGSDKQTIHTANTADQGDNFKDMARAIRAGGAMDADTAYIEAVGSARAMASLQFLGLPLPQDPLGGTLRYQTDHDDVGRATSCGPRTSRLMVQVLAAEAIRLGIPFFNQTSAVRIVTAGGRVAGVLAIRPKSQSAANPLRLMFFQCAALVIAAGGPGELYRDSVFPNGCFGSLGLALEAGLDMVNLTESQFGIGTRREGFPWNLSGTYVQAMPHIYSVDDAGTERPFLADYYRTTQEMASNVFRKGYQWPFHASRMLDFGSSLVDLAIVREGHAGRRVFMDFNRNPQAVDQPSSLDRLDRDVSAYLHNAGAMQALPIDRLRHMNPLSIELYRRYKVDIAAAPLEFAVNNQHMNGGIAVDVWGRSSVPGIYAVGEAAGTHGVTRPCGAALNARQVFGTRVAEHIAASGVAAGPSVGDCAAALQDAVARIGGVLQADSKLILRDLRDEIQARMSDHAGIFYTADAVAQALQEARALNAWLARHGVRAERGGRAARGGAGRRAFCNGSKCHVHQRRFWRRWFITSAMAAAVAACAICDPAGEALPMARSGPLQDYRFRTENPADRQAQLVVRLQAWRLHVAARPVRSFDEAVKPFFERDWPAWLTGAVYDLEPLKS